MLLIFLLICDKKTIKKNYCNDVNLTHKINEEKFILYNLKCCNN